MTKEQLLKLLERNRNDKKFQESLIGNVSHLTIVLQILVIEMQDISLDQVMEIDKKKIKMKDFMKYTENTALETADVVRVNEINVPIDKEAIKKYEELIRSSLVWQ